MTGHRATETIALEHVEDSDIRVSEPTPQRSSTP
jgi:hypothetical protein